MDDETGWILERIKLYELIKAHPDWSLRRYARELQHDLQWVRRWAARIRSAAALTLDTFRSHSRAPHHPPARIHADAKRIVGELRHELSEKFHRRAGPKTILYGLREYAKKHLLPFDLPKAASTITRILHELGCILPPRPVTHEPLELPPPMSEWEMDFGEIWLGEEAGVFEFFVVIDRGTSRLVYVEGCAGYTAETALEAVARLFAACGLPQRLRFDRDPRLWGSWSRDSYPSPLIRFLRVLGVDPVVCPPHRPDLKPFVERCIGTLKFEWIARLAPTTLGEALNTLAFFPAYYNTERPNQGQACQNQPPAVAFPELPTLPGLPTVVDPDRWLHAIHQRVYRRWVNSNGTVQVDRHVYRIGTEYAKQRVLLHVDAHQRVFNVIIDEQVLKQLPIRGLHGEALDFEVYLLVLREEARSIAAHHRLLWEQRATVA